VYVLIRSALYENLRGTNNFAELINAQSLLQSGFLQHKKRNFPEDTF